MTFFDLRNHIQNLINNSIDSFVYNDEIVNLPSPQRSGTGTQQSSYALQAATKIAKSLS